MRQPRVAVLKTTPQTCDKDYGRVMDLAGFRESMNPLSPTVIKINITWQKYFPSCSTTPWQLDGVLKKLLELGFCNIHPVENFTVVTDPYKGMKTNKLSPVLGRYKLKFECLADMDWEKLEPSKTLVLKDTDMMLPTIIAGAQVIHLPTLKCHGHSTMTCSIKNAFGFLQTIRHHYHLCIHKVLVDLLRIQKEYCKNLFSIVDSTLAMDGAGPRTGVPKVKDIILAGEDLVAVDAVAAKIMGVDPLSIGYIGLAHEEGLGVGDLDDIEVIGEDISNINFGFKTKYDPVIYFDRFFRGSPLKKLLFKPPLFSLVVFLSDVYRGLWLKTRGRTHMNRIMKTEWGSLFQSYPYE